MDLDENRQLQIFQQLNIPRFLEEEKVQIDEEEVSDEDSELDEAEAGAADDKAAQQNAYREMKNRVANKGLKG